MRNVRLIARLDVKAPNLVKGIQLEGLRKMGDPNEFASKYYLQGVDEIYYEDIVASLYERNSLIDIIEKTTESVFVPITVGGGLRSIDDVAAALRAGADKVSINTAAHKEPDLITNASKMFGRSTIVVAIEAIRQNDGSYHAFTDNGRNRTGREVVSWAMEVERLGAGEILITSVDKEGTGDGLDMELIRKVIANINLPLVVHGGVGRPEHVQKVAKELKISGVAIASMLHYQYLESNKNKLSACLAPDQRRMACTENMGQNSYLVHANRVASRRI